MELKKIIKKNYKWILILICIIGFLAIAEDVWKEELMQEDVIGYKFISTYLINDKLTPIIKFITNLGNATVLISLDAILTFIFVIKKRKDLGIEITLNLVIITLLNILIKNIIQRPRPDEYRIINEKGYSFPSGHSMISMAFYGFLIYLIYKNVKNNYIKWISIILIFILILLIGTSRIYLGVHYATDVIAGFLVSIAYLFAYTDIIKRIGSD